MGSKLGAVSLAGPRFAVLPLTFEVSSVAWAYPIIAQVSSHKGQGCFGHCPVMMRPVLNKSRLHNCYSEQCGVSLNSAEFS
ncbi:predicted protein [Histoplasma capsulatum G186AR]|uniref:Uncharacterized protein n=1 Tax=Ajellomyces capsulatus (strain G186AR / H82 / ATCC MYA-2454 / RMSCC 2432) TaxID=447093 RepID=C0NFP5_AJECG|nr:uncharacterized protein HCBG_01711 [Histoplasma capsulatum G186AR]EEH10066.1 predicted protein [Histoplasma capsulatum G186AR]